MAGAVPSTHLGAARAPAARRAVLRRPRGDARPDARARAPERRQPARHQLLPLASGRPPHRSPHGERREAVLRSIATGSTRCWRPVVVRSAKRARSSTTLIGPATTASAGSTDPANSTCRSVSTRGSPTRATSLRTARCSPAGRSLPATWNRCRSSRGDFIYADPPYDVEFTHYAKDRFTWADQERTAGWLAAHPGPVVLVNQATERVEKLYRKLGFEVRFLNAPRRISRTGDRTPAREIIATRNL